MPYAPNPIHMHQDISGHGVVIELDRAIFSGPVDTFLISYWEYGGGNAQQFFITDNPGGAGGISFEPSHRISPASDLVVGAATSTVNMLAVDYLLPGDPACAYHFLVSVRLSTSTVQFYLNDVAVTGSPTWTTPGPITFSGPSTVACWGASWAPFAVNSQGYGSDFWFGTTSGFVDLTVTTNRRKFINADKTPVDLGSAGQNPFGTSPQIFQNVLAGGVASDWLINRGSVGGTFLADTGTMTLDGNPCGSTAPATSATLTDSELFFTPTGGFTDLSNVALRRLFISSGITPQWMGRNGALPFGSAPAVYLTTMGPPRDFAQNNGHGGAFAVIGVG